LTLQTYNFNTVDLAKAALTPAEESSNLTFVKRLKLQEAPSKVANVENAKIKFSAEDCQYLVHRPLDRTGDPVVLLECVFGEFVENCATIPLRETDYYDALRFQSLMVKFYGQEEERYKVVNTFLSDYLKVSVERLGTDIASSRTMDIGHRVRNGILILHGGLFSTYST
jgi:hypothetical protein